MSPETHNVCLYGLSTCVHCKHACDFLEKKGIAFDCVYVDKLVGETRTETINTVRKFNPRISFPTIVVDNGAHVLVGFKEDELSKALDL